MTTFLSNADGAAVSDGADVLHRLVAQVTRPVRWDACQATLRELGATSLIELPPAGTLVGLARRERAVAIVGDGEEPDGRELKGVRTLALKTPDDLGAAAELVAADLPGQDRAAHDSVGSTR